VQCVRLVFPAGCSKRNVKLQVHLPCTTLPLQLFYYSTVAPSANVSVTIDTRTKIKVMHLQATDATNLPGLYRNSILLAQQGFAVIILQNAVRRAPALEASSDIVGWGLEVAMEDTIKEAQPKRSGECVCKYYICWFRSTLYTEAGSCKQCIEVNYRIVCTI
jgi:hypothetical protein